MFAVLVPCEFRTVLPRWCLVLLSRLSLEMKRGNQIPHYLCRKVWSISYSAPEAWTCYVQDEFCDDKYKGMAGPHGYDPSLYLHRANVELMKLVLLGVSSWTNRAQQTQT